MEELDITFDYNATKEYRFLNKSQCDCLYCRNYYETFSTKYPKISKFLESFGLDIKFPLEIMPLEYNELEDTIEYISYYPVKGNINKHELIVNLNVFEVRVLKGSDLNNPCPNPHMKEPYLIIELGIIKLPWVLDEKP